VPKPKRKQVRPIDKPSILDKKFKPVVATRMPVSLKSVPSVIVIANLRRGSLKSLDQYLRQRKGIADRQIAVELRKLISGSQERSPYRLVVTRHPDSPNQGGRPR
jgi:hypothetical protein